MDVKRFPEIHDINKTIDVIRNLSVIVTEFTHKNGLVTIQFKDNDIFYAPNNNKPYKCHPNIDVPPHSSYTNISRSLDEIILMRKLNKTPIKNFTLYGRVEGSTYHIFAMRNGHDQFVSWEKVVEFAKMTGLGTYPILYRGPYRFDRIVHAFNKPSKFLDKETTDLLIMPDPPTEDTIKGKYDYLFFSMISINKKHEIEPSTVANEFVSVFVKPEYIKTAYDFVDGHNLWQKGGYNEIIPLIAYILLEKNKREYELYLEKIIYRSKATPEKCKKDLAKELMCEIENTLRLMGK
jgi:hypothetical protein